MKIKVGDLVQAKWMDEPGVVLSVYDNGEILVKENENCFGTLPSYYYKLVRSEHGYEQLRLFDL